MVNLISTANANDRSGAKVVMYGRPKVGKTKLIASAPDPVIFSSEHGLLSLREFQLPVVEIASMKDLEDAFAWVASSAEAKQFKTVCWDSVTDTADMILAAERKNNVKKSDNWAPFNALAEKFTEKLRETRNMKGKNFYLICQEEQIKEAGGMLVAGPMLPGKVLLQALPYLYDGIFQFVCHTDPVTGAVTRMIKTHGDNVSLGGDRSGNLDAWEPADLTRIFNKMLS